MGTDENGRSRSATHDGTALAVAGSVAADAAKATLNKSILELFGNRLRACFGVAAIRGRVGGLFTNNPPAIYWRRSQLPGSTGWPFRRSSKYSAGCARPPELPTRATASPRRTLSPTFFSSDSLWA